MLGLRAVTRKDNAYFAEMIFHIGYKRVDCLLPEIGVVAVIQAVRFVDKQDPADCLGKYFVRLYSRLPDVFRHKPRSVGFDYLFSRENTFVV